MHKLYGTFRVVLSWYQASFSSSDCKSLGFHGWGHLTFVTVSTISRHSEKVHIEVSAQSKSTLSINHLIRDRRTIFSQRCIIQWTCGTYRENELWLYGLLPNTKTSLNLSVFKNASYIATLAPKLSPKTSFSPSVACLVTSLAISEAALSTKKSFTKRDSSWPGMSRMSKF
ncbi:hypothetical protein HG535_0A09220 [Zygotorulaspora mrakii]|uniref:Uncharacterized protein n=1 Tax=Zygotorulaspora mrakii TaxID=42260 RepID=A0A7H9AXF8_ZYGMR|nr:uncharacterized protein HG535_0A09220 [Zygotorulaspora mrakii]QLG70971.1 hypothetical protein HG535_0A09220 [Zygotorulaspora mrakii]